MSAEPIYGLDFDKNFDPGEGENAYLIIYTFSKNITLPSKLTLHLEYQTLNKSTLKRKLC